MSSNNQYDLMEVVCLRCERKSTVLAKDGVPMWCPMPSEEDFDYGRICAGQMVSKARYDELKERDMI